MTKEQRNKILEIIDNYCEIRFKYVSMKGGKPRFCVLGGILNDMGENLILNFYNRSRNAQLIESLSNIMKKLNNIYGLTSEQCIELQRTNDSISNRKLRQNKLRHIVNNWVVED